MAESVSDRLANFERERPQVFLQHASICTSQYDAQYRSMASEILLLRESVGRWKKAAEPIDVK